MNKEYAIHPKYCPSLKKNVPVMVFSDGKHSEQCWNCERCSEKCALNLKPGTFFPEMPNKSPDIL